MSRELVRRLAEAGCTVSPDVVDRIEPSDVDNILDRDEVPDRIDSSTIRDLEDSEDQGVQEEKIEEEETVSEDDSSDDSKENVNEGDRRTNVVVEKNFEGSMKSRDVEDFVQYFNDRYFRMKALLSKRMELKDAVSLETIDEYKGDSISTIAMVSDKYKTDSGKWIVYIEDPSDRTKALVDEDEGDRIVEDEVLGIVGNVGDDIVFADKIVRPDVPISRDVKETEEEVHAAFVSDLHIGSSEFLMDKMKKLIDWINNGEEDIRYLFVVGDVVAGVGNYPGQKDHLEIEDVYEQYHVFEELIDKLDRDVQVIIIPGNHDFVRLAEPQPKLPREVCPDIYDKENIHWLSNPSSVVIHGFEGEEGIRVLLYHGYSFDNHRDMIPDLRDKGMDEPHHCMIDFIKRRHLAPTFGSCLLSPEEEDILVMDKIPDIFAMGHTHAMDVYNYKGINIISCGTMESQTDFQKRIGHEPDPAMVPVVNLKTRETVVKEL